MKKDRLMGIIDKLIEYIDESLEHDGEKLYSVLTDEIGMTGNEIDDITLGEE